MDAGPSLRGDNTQGTARVRSAVCPPSRACQPKGPQPHLQAWTNATRREHPGFRCACVRVCTCVHASGYREARHVALGVRCPWRHGGGLGRCAGRGGPCKGRGMQRSATAWGSCPWAAPGQPWVSIGSLGRHVALCCPPVVTEGSPQAPWCRHRPGLPGKGGLVFAPGARAPGARASTLLALLRPARSLHPQPADVPCPDTPQPAHLLTPVLGQHDGPGQRG